MWKASRGLCPTLETWEDDSDGGEVCLHLWTVSEQLTLLAVSSLERILTFYRIEKATLLVPLATQGILLSRDMAPTQPNNTKYLLSLLWDSSESPLTVWLTSVTLQLPSVPLGPEVCHGLAQPKCTHVKADLINKICSPGGECQESSRLKTTGYIYIEICYWKANLH